MSIATERCDGEDAGAIRLTSETSGAERNENINYVREGHAPRLCSMEDGLILEGPYGGAHRIGFCRFSLEI